MNKNIHPTPTINPRTVHPADQAKGEAAELTFRQWLDADVTPHLYIDQTPMTVPAPMRGQIKRPDYLVGIPGTGMVAFDVKAKTVYDEGLLFNLDEVRRLRTFAHCFNLTVYFACLDPHGGPDGCWVRLNQLDNAPAMRRGGNPLQPRSGELALYIPLSHTLPVSLEEGFYDVFVRAARSW